MPTGQKKHCLGQRGQYRLTRWLEENQAKIVEAKWTQIFVAVKAGLALSDVVNTNHIKSCNASLDTPIVWPKSKKANVVATNMMHMDTAMLLGMLNDIGTLAQAVETGLYWDGPTPPSGDKQGIQQIQDRCRMAARGLK